MILGSSRSYSILG
ncbi:hypothetical protein LINPERPRIM_LOCUS33383 [Linum perenne]